MSKKSNITVLVAPLDWGLGHATRCIPIINQLLQSGCKVIIATEGIQKELLKTEFPNVIFVDIPGYRIKYAKAKRFFALKIAWQIPKILTAIITEKKWLDNFLKNNTVNAVISDNRYGLFHDKVTSVFITHQLLIKAPFLYLEKVMLRINYRFIKKFSTCWVPDEQGLPNLAGALSHPPVSTPIKVDYIGGLSRLKRQQDRLRKYDILIILSGPEPQRSELEKKIVIELEDFAGKAMLIRGLPGSTDLLSTRDDIVIENHLPAKDLEAAINESEYIISRSGYTTIMDICKLQKKSILIPTPGQTEQEYLAYHLQKQGWCIAVSQHKFRLGQCLEKAKKLQIPPS